MKNHFHSNPPAHRSPYDFWRDSAQLRSCRDADRGKKFADIILRLIRDVRPDALYMDQLGAVPIQLDWSENLVASRLGQWCYNQGLFCEAVTDRLH